MANYTPHYRLHQWEPEDKFLRTDFNEDFAALDAALERAEQTGQRLQHDLEAQAYNLYHLLLRQEYEGKYTGYRKAMLFDGFMDGNCVAEKSGSTVIRGGLLLLSRTGQGNVNWGYGTGVAQNPESKVAEITGGGTLTGFECKIRNSLDGPAPAILDARLYMNDKLLLDWRVNGSDVAMGTSQVLSFPLEHAVPVRAGDRVKLSLKCYSLRAHTAPEGTYLGGKLLCTPAAGKEGWIKSTPCDMPVGQAARGWVHYRGGTVGLSLCRGGETIPMTAGESRPSIDLLSGEACMEQAFTLDRAIPAGSWQARLSSSLGTESEAEVLDYGVIVV